MSALNTIVYELNVFRKKYVETKDKIWWWQIIQLLPSSYNQKRTVTMNYENILNIYRQRKSHKLNKWSGKDDSSKDNFIKWITELLYAKELIMYEVKEQ